MRGLGLGLRFYLWVGFMFGLVCKYFLGVIVAGANVMEPFQKPRFILPSDQCMSEKISIIMWTNLTG